MHREGYGFFHFHFNLTNIVPAIIVTGGEAELASYAELLYPDGTNSWCKLPNMGGRNKDNTQNGFVSCGGGDEGKTCQTLVDGSWKASGDLNKRRIHHISWKRPDGKIHLMGGSESPRTTEIFDIEKGESQKDFKLKEKVM